VSDGKVSVTDAAGELSTLTVALPVLVPLVAVIFWIGVYPKPFLERTAPSTSRFVAMVGETEPSPPVAEADAGTAVAEADAAAVAATAESDEP